MRAQGDGEVSGTAIECPSRAQLTLDLRDDLPLEWPCARIDGAWLTFGFDEHLGRAAKKAVDGMLALMGASTGSSPRRRARARERRRRPARDAGRERAARRARGAARRRLACDASGCGSGSSATGAARATTCATRRRASACGGRTRASASSPVAGVSFRPEAVADSSFDPGRAPRARAGAARTSTTRTRSASGTRSARCRRATSRATSRPSWTGDEQAVSLWRAGEGLRVLLVAARRLGRAAPQVASAAVAYEFKLPDLGEGLTEGEVARWLVAEGDEIAEDAAARRDPDRQDDGRDPVPGGRPRRRASSSPRARSSRSARCSS